MEPKLNKTFQGRIIDDKNLYDLFYPELRQPKTVLRRIGGMFLDGNYNVISEDNIGSLVSGLDMLIIKQASFSMGGHGVSLWNKKDGLCALIERLKKDDNCICQEFIEQHEVMSKLNPSSINTLRIASLLLDGEVHIVTQFVRFGCEGARIDNVSSGGMYCGINDDGSLKGCAYSQLGTPIYTHPSGFNFSEIVIPSFSICLDLVKRYTPRMSNISCLQSWDFAISKGGEPILIEPNFEYPDIIVNQIACGPLFSTVLIEKVRKKYDNELFPITQWN